MSLFTLLSGTSKSPPAPIPPDSVQRIDELEERVKCLQVILTDLQTVLVNMKL